MITIDVAEYCSACMDFDPDVQRPQKAYGMSEEIVISDTVIRCSNRNRCKNIERYLRKKVTNDGVGKTDEAMPCTIEMLNAYRENYLETKDKQDWWQMIQLLPSSYNQRRTVMLNYEVLANIYKSRRNHKLDEWHTFCDWIESLPYSELITGKEEKADV